MPVLSRKRRGPAPQEHEPSQRRRVSGLSTQANGERGSQRDTNGRRRVGRHVSEDEEDEAEVERVVRERRDNSGDNGNGSDDYEDGYGEEEDTRTEGEITRDRMVKGLIRLALASEFTRQPIRRTDISAKVLGNNFRAFREVFDEAQLQLRHVFGMELVKMPMKDKITIAQKRAAQRSERPGNQDSGQYMLVTVLSDKYRIPEILGAGSTQLNEETYVGLVTTIVSLVYLNGKSLSEPELLKHLRKLNADENTPIDKTEKLLQTMVKHGYLLRVKEDISGDHVFEYHLGPRAKVEIGKEGVLNMLENVYGIQAPENLAERLSRSIGIEGEPVAKDNAPKQRGRAKPRRQENEDAMDEDDDGDDD